MKKIIALILALFSTLLAQEASKPDLLKIIDAVSKKYAPDKRTEIFEVQFYEKDRNLILKGETTQRVAKDELISQLKSAFNIVDSIVVLPSPELGDKVYGVISVSVGNMRAKPAHQAELVNQVLMGSSVKILKRHNYWYLVQTEPPENYIGWIEEGGLAIFNKDEFEKWKNLKKVIFIDYFGFVYSQKDKNSIPVSDLSMGNVIGFEEKESDGKWIKVILPDKRTGYVEKNAVVELNRWRNAVNLSASNIINTAKKFVGFPYLWGGTSVRGFDCSGFTKIVFKMNGFELPRDADQQSKLGIEVEPGENFENLKPGDLLFFGQKAEDGKPEKITHVGIYIGNKEFIHCSGKVSIDSFDPQAPNFNEYRYKTFIRAKRLLQK